MSFAAVQRQLLVSKIVTELEAHLGIAEKVIAEFIIDLAGKHKNADAAFHKDLAENGLDCPRYFSDSLLRIIDKMKPEAGGKQAQAWAAEVGGRRRWR